MVASNKKKRKHRCPAIAHFSFYVFVFLISSFYAFVTGVSAQRSLTLVEMNCENLFDCLHDEGKDDYEFTPSGARHWTPSRYWRKLNGLAQTILASSASLPDLVALVEVENDSVLHALTRRSLLRNGGYEYLMTSSPDVRGVDVALLYRPLAFLPLCYDMLSVEPLTGMRPTRDILYVKGLTLPADTLHVFVVHAPSRRGGERSTRPYRQRMAEVLTRATSAIIAKTPDARIVVAGDFNSTLDGHSLRYIIGQGLVSATSGVTGAHGARSNYRYHGRWEQIDHVLVSPSLLPCIAESSVFDAPFLLEPDELYGGVKPFRTYNGFRYQHGFSDHLPLVVVFSLQELPHN